MGNVLASSGSSSNKLAASLGVPEVPSSTKDTELSVKEETKLENPGTVEELHKKCKDIQAMTFEGAKIMLNKGLSNHFQVSHTLNMSSTTSGYRFGATYVGTKQYTPSEAYPVLLGDIDPAGNLNANVIHQFSSSFRGKFAAQFQDSKLMAIQITGDHRGDDYTASVTVGNPNLFNNSGVIVAQYLQSITPRLSLGAEIAYQCGPNVPGRQIAVVSGVGRYHTGDSVWSGTLGASGLHMCYYQKASEQLQIGIEIETSLRMSESIAIVAYQVDLPKADLVFKGSVDSNWLISGVLEKRLQPLPFSFALSGHMNHAKNHFKLGCGLIIG